MPDRNGKRIAIIGAGGHARETLLLLRQCGVPLDDVAGFFIDAEFWKSGGRVEGRDLKCIDEFDHRHHVAVIGIGDGKLRRRFVEQLPGETDYPSYVHPSAWIADGLSLPEGVMIHAGCILTTNITVERHVHLNRSTNVGHDTRIRAFATTSPGVVISGNCDIGDASNLGASSCIREKQIVGAGAVLGMGAVLVSDIPPGATYVGNPAHQLSKRRQNATP